MSKPYGLTATMQVIRPSRAEDKIYEAVQEAICANMTVTDFIKEAREAWAYELREQAMFDDGTFKRAVKP